MSRKIFECREIPPSLFFGTLLIYRPSRLDSDSTAFVKALTFGSFLPFRNRVGVARTFTRLASWICSAQNGQGFTVG